MIKRQHFISTREGTASAVPKSFERSGVLTPEVGASGSQSIYKMGVRRRSVFSFVLMVALGVLPLVAQTQQEDRVKAIGGKFLCMCGCNQILTQCNHVGCTVSAAMLKELRQRVDRGESEASITQAFVQEYGTTVYAEPPKTGFSLIAWAMPVIYFIGGAVLVLFVISRWRKRPQAVGVDAAAPVTASGAKISPEAMERARAQAARETED
jgi:cytochrome c-type biogenesis protein CcmH